MQLTNFYNKVLDIKKNNPGNDSFNEMSGAILLFQLVHLSVDKYFLMLASDKVYHLC